MRDHIRAVEGLFEGDGRLDHALWWLRRWVSGSMRDSDWSWPEAESVGLRAAG